MKQGMAYTGHPVDISSGQAFTAWHDLVISGRIPLIWRRFYSTSLVDSGFSSVGRGWTHFFDARLTYRDGAYQFFGHDGHLVFFEDDRNTVQTGGRVLNPGWFMDIQKEGDRHVVTHWHDWESQVRKFSFRRVNGHDFLLDAIESPAGERLILVYEQGRLSEIHQSVELRGARVEYDDRGLIHRLYLLSPQAPPELVASYQYDEGQRLTAVFDPSNSAIRYSYNREGLLLSESGHGGGTFRMDYDSLRRCRETAGEGGRLLRRFEFDEPGRITRVTNGLGETTEYHMNASGQVEAEVFPDGSSQLRQYDLHGRILTWIGRAGETTAYTYHPRGDIATVTHPNGSTSAFSYDGDHQPLTVEEPDGAVWTFRYERGALVALNDPIGAETRYLRDEKNHLAEVWHSNGNKVRISRDPDWSRESWHDRDGLLFTRDFNARMDITELSDARGVRVSLRYDSLGRLEQIQTPHGARRLIRDRVGNVVEHIDGNSQITRFQYSPYGDLIRLTLPTGDPYRFAYDLEGRLTRVTNPRAETTDYNYHPGGWLRETKAFDGRVDRFELDMVNQLVVHQKPDGEILHYLHDASWNLLAVEHRKTRLVVNEYDACDRLVRSSTPASTVEFEFDLVGRVVAETQNGRRLKVDFSPGGRVSRQDFEGSEVGPIFFEHDPRGRVVTASTQRGAFQRFAYDPAGHMVARKLGAALEEFQYDESDRIRSQEVLLDGKSLVSRSFEYDSEGNYTRLRDSLRGESLFRYDPNMQIVGVSDQSGEKQHRYDECGNLVEKGSLRLQYAAGNRLVTLGSEIHVSDANGHVVSRTSPEGSAEFRWNALGQLVGVLDSKGVLTTYGYDGLGRRTLKETQGETTRYYWAGDDLLREESEGGEAIDYLSGGFFPYALWENGEIRHVVASPGGVPHELLTAGGEIEWAGTYDEWGHLVGETASGLQNLRLPGQYWDPESGLHLNRFRFYDPVSGRYLSPDPLGLEGGLNEFLYAPNALNWSDPLGLTCGNTGCGVYSVYVLKHRGKICYVGITSQLESARCRQHRIDKTFTEMVVVSENLNYRQARNLEGSALKHISEETLKGGIDPKGLYNELRTDGSFYHSYHDPPYSSRKRKLLTPRECSNEFRKKVRTHY